MATKSVQMGCGVAMSCRPMPKPGVCRCLFGRPTAEELSESTTEARQLLQLNTDEMSKKYDFDFSTGTPYGNSRVWDWQKIKEKREEVTDKVVVSDLTNNSAVHVDRHQPPSIELSAQLCTVQSIDSTNVVEINVAAPIPAEPIPTTSDLITSVSSTMSRKRRGDKTLKDYYQVKKQRSAPSPVTIKDIDSCSSSSSDSSCISQS